MLWIYTTRPEVLEHKQHTHIYAILVEYLMKKGFPSRQNSISSVLSGSQLLFQFVLMVVTAVQVCVSHPFNHIVHIFLFHQHQISSLSNLSLTESEFAVVF